MKAATRNLTDLQPASSVAEAFRVDAGRRGAIPRQAELGQFLTPLPTARLIGSMIEAESDTVRILDAGAGAGALFAAAVLHLCSRRTPPAAISVTAYEIDADLSAQLRTTAKACATACALVGVDFSSEVISADFLAAAADTLEAGVFAPDDQGFDVAILNPPYYKINARSGARAALRRIGVETSNIYTGFLAATAKLLRPGGELVAITPRSFCNGTYFRSFRKWFLGEMRLRRIHSFHSRQEAFRDDDVLQETVIFRAVKGAAQRRIAVSSSTGPDDPNPTSRAVDYARVVRPDDPQYFICIPTDDLADQVAEHMTACRATLTDLGLTVSTGRVVDFRAREYLRDKPGKRTAPLIWPTHFEGGYIVWPKNGSSRKPEAILAAEAVADQLVPCEPYVLVRRFSAKEERRRVVAAVFDPKRVPCETVGFENHLNYFHRNGRGVGITLARGLAAFLNSTIVDQFFRQFSGHTQVNATDLRNMRYPMTEQLEQIGAAIGGAFPNQTGVDAIVARELFGGDPMIAGLSTRIRANGTSPESLPS